MPLSPPQHERLGEGGPAACCVQGSPEARLQALEWVPRTLGEAPEDRPG